MPKARFGLRESTIEKVREMGTRLTPASAPLNALVTGGNRGLGLEVVKIILRHAPGSHVFLGCRDLDDGRRIAASLEAGPGQVTAVRLDVSSETSIVAAAETIVDSVSHLDLLVNNAGILHEEWSMDTARATMRTNFDGMVAVTEAFLPMLHSRTGGGASILSTSSGVGARTLGMVSEEHRSGLCSPTLELPALRSMLSQIMDDLGAHAEHPYHAIPTVAYGLSKMGVNVYTQLLARQYPTLCVNACSPGFTNTGMCANYAGDRKPKDIPLGASVFAKVNSVARHLCPSLSQNHSLKITGPAPLARPPPPKHRTGPLRRPCRTHGHLF